MQVVAFPCNQFGRQEPSSDEELRGFAAAQGLSLAKGFHLMAKVDVNGRKAAKSWQALKEATKTTSQARFEADLRWIFNGFQ